MMSRLLRLSLALTTLLLALAASSARALEPGEPAPAFELRGPKAQVSLADAKGKLVYLDFWASWCGPCRQSFPWMNDIQAKYGPQGFQVLAVNLDAKTADAEKFLAKYPAAFTLAFDPKGETPRKYGVKGMPTSFLISREGVVLARHMGFNDGERAALERQIEQALKGNP